jgi:hypothetical protein
MNLAVEVVIYTGAFLLAGADYLVEKMLPAATSHHFDIHVMVQDFFVGEGLTQPQNYNLKDTCTCICKYSQVINKSDLPYY